MLSTDALHKTSCTIQYGVSVRSSWISHHHSSVYSRQPDRNIKTTPSVPVMHASTAFHEVEDVKGSSAR